MARVSIQLPDDLRARVEARASETGHGSVEEYVQSLLRADLDDSELTDDDLEALLVRRIDSPDPDIEVTPDFVRQFKERIEKRRRAGGGGGA